MSDAGSPAAAGAAGQGGGGSSSAATAAAYAALERERTGEAPGGVAERGRGASGAHDEQGPDPRELGAFLDALDHYNPTIPEEVTAYFLQQSGVTVMDPRIKKLVSLAAEKLVSEVVHDTTTYARMKEQDGETLRMEDLKESLEKYGVLKTKIMHEEGEGGDQEEEGEEDEQEQDASKMGSGRGRGRERGSGVGKRKRG